MTRDNRFNEEKYLQQLEEPTIKYEFQGKYRFNGEEFTHVGFVTLDPHGNFVGKIYDPYSRCKHHGVKGMVKTENGRTIISLYKIPDGYATLYYQLEKVKEMPGGKEPFEGIYKGRWVFTKEGTDIDEMMSEEKLSELMTELQNDTTCLMFYRSILEQ